MVQSWRGGRTAVDISKIARYSFRDKITLFIYLDQDCERMAEQEDFIDILQRRRADTAKKTLSSRLYNELTQILQRTTERLISSLRFKQTQVVGRFM